ncbi:MAG: hypothetical protein CMK02_08300 [Polycyclovorans sp.]|jgi:hypothetical protein|nr:hypothetical protein [Polycyclovorans sp.]|tara:strand:- start:759 stop:1157 length:399 start_codon:yes stop_codon:yes gene_type:complete
MDLLRAAEISYKSYFIALCAGSFSVSVLGSLVLSADPVALVGALFLSFFVGAFVVLLIAAPIHASLLSVGWANYTSTVVSALLISAATHPIGGIPMIGLFALYGLPIAVFAHYLAVRAARKPPDYIPGPLRG